MLAGYSGSVVPSATHPFYDDSSVIAVKCPAHTTGNDASGDVYYGCTTDDGFYGTASPSTDEPFIVSTVKACTGVQFQHETAPGIVCSTGTDSQIAGCKPGYDLCKFGGTGGTCFGGATPHTTADTCIEINECEFPELVTCNGRGTCINQVHAYTCTCDPGFTGKDCQTNINDCDAALVDRAGEKCANGGVCVDGNNTYSCDCQPGFTGELCKGLVDCPANSDGTVGGTGGTGAQSGCAVHAGFSGSVTGTTDGAFFISTIGPAPCPEGSSGFVPTGCTRKKGFSGSVSPSTVGPLYYTGAITAVKCPAPESLGVVPGDSGRGGLSGCEMLPGYAGIITASTEFPYYNSSANNIECPTYSTGNVALDQMCVRLQDDAIDGLDRFEAVYAGQWSSVCSNGFDDKDAHVACRQLGYSMNVGHGEGNIGGTGDIMFAEMACDGTELTFKDCAGTKGGDVAQGEATDQCNHGKDVFLQCAGTYIGSNTNPNCGCKVYPGFSGTVVPTTDEGNGYFVSTLAPVLCPTNTDATNKNNYAYYGCTPSDGFFGVVTATTIGPDFIDSDVKPCTPVPNQHATPGLTCTSASDSQILACSTGFSICHSGSSKACSDGTQPDVDADTCTDTNECISMGVTCSNRGTCNNLFNDYTCVCDGGFAGKDCETNIDECEAKQLQRTGEKCSNGGQCNDGDNAFSCTCLAGYSGKLCDTNVVCPPNSNGFVGGHPGGYTGTGGKSSCTVLPGYSGTVVATITDRFYTSDIAPVDCPQYFAGANVFTCKAVDGYFGTVVPTATTPFYTATVAECKVVANYDSSQSLVTCTSAVDSQVTACNRGFRLCESGGLVCSDGTNADLSADKCTAIDECNEPAYAISPCLNGQCEDGLAGYTCNCDTTGFSGDRCQTDIDECLAAMFERAGDKCANGRCVNGKNEFTCDCTGTGFQGEFCETDVNECAVEPCKNGADCINLANAYSCKCRDSIVSVTPSGYTGKNCDEDIDECDRSQFANPCSNDGDCVNNVGGMTCGCADGYSGQFCDGEVKCQQDHYVFEKQCKPCTYGSTRDAGDTMVGIDTECKVNYVASDETEEVEALVQISIVASGCVNETVLNCAAAVTPDNEKIACAPAVKALNTTNPFWCTLVCEQGCGGTIAARDRREEPISLIKLTVVVGHSETTNLVENVGFPADIPSKDPSGTSTVNFGGVSGATSNINIPLSLLEQADSLAGTVSNILTYSEEQQKLNDCSEHGKKKSKKSHNRCSHKHGKKGKKGEVMPPVILTQGKGSKKLKKSKAKSGKGAVDTVNSADANDGSNQKQTTRWEVERIFSADSSPHSAVVVASKRAAALTASVGVVAGFIIVIVGAIMKRKQSKQQQWTDETTSLLGATYTGTSSNVKYVSVEG